MDYITARRLLGNRIRNIRKEKNITQERLAELIDKTTEHMSFIERGERSPSFEVLIDLSKALEVSLSYLLSIEPDGQDVPSIPAPIPTSSLPDTVKDPIKPKEERKTDLERLQAGLESVRALQQLATEYEFLISFKTMVEKSYSY